MKNIDLIQKVHMIGGEDRMSLKPFARSLKMTDEAAKKMFAATGIIKCGRVSSTIQLSGGDAIVTTVGHAIMEPDSCNEIREPCKITFPFSSKPNKIYKMKPGSWVAGACNPKSAVGDWAVFELTESVEGANYYKIPEEDRPYINPPKSVLKVAALADNFMPTEGEERKKHNYNFEVCRIRDRNIYSYAPLQSDCDTGLGTSGAAELVLRNNEYYLNSIAVSESGSVSGQEYNSRAHFNISVPVEGDFLKEIRRRLSPQ